MILLRGDNRPVGTNPAGRDPPQPRSPSASAPPRTEGLAELGCLTPTRPAAAAGPDVQLNTPRVNKEPPWLGGGRGSGFTLRIHPRAGRGESAGPAQPQRHGGPGPAPPARPRSPARPGAPRGSGPTCSAPRRRSRPGSASRAGGRAGAGGSGRGRRPREPLGRRPGAAGGAGPGPEPPQPGMLQGDTNPAPGASPSEPAAAGGVSGEHPQPHAESDQCLAAQQQRGRVPTAAG